MASRGSFGNGFGKGKEEGFRDGLRLGTTLGEQSGFKKGAAIAGTVVTVAGGILVGIASIITNKSNK